MMRKLRREVKAGREDAARVEAVKMQPEMMRKLKLRRCR
jgi:hypothetical protein